MENNHLKIVLVLGSNKWGGGEKHVFDIIKNLQDKFEFILITKKSEVLTKQFSPLNIQHIEWNMNFKLSNLAEHKKQISLLNSIKADGIHCHLNDASFMLSIYRPFIKTKIISTVHGFSSHLYYLFPHYLISVSKAIHEYLLPTSQVKSTVIYNGVCEETQQRNSPAELQAYIFATIHPNKGQEFVCNSLQKIDHHSKITFIGTGAESYQNRLTQKINESSPNIDWIALTGDLQPYFDKASFIIIPSFKEALSYVALEALSRGIPVLASSTGGLTEVFENEKEGLFFKTGDSVDFVKKLHLMEKNHSQYKKYLLENPFLAHHPHFQIDEMCNKISRYYINTFK